MYGTKLVVYNLVKEKKQITLPEIRKQLRKYNYNTIRGALVQLERAGLIKRVDLGNYTFIETKE